MNLVNVDLLPQIDNAADQMTAAEARELVIQHEKALQQLDLYANVRLLLEALMLKWPTLNVPKPDMTDQSPS